MSNPPLVLSYLDQLVHESQVAADFPGMAAGMVFCSPSSCNFFHKTCWNVDAFITSLCNFHFLRKQPSNIKGKMFLRYLVQLEQDINSPFRHVLDCQ